MTQTHMLCEYWRECARQKLDPDGECSHSMIHKQKATCIGSECYEHSCCGEVTIDRRGRVHWVDNGRFA